MTNRTLSNRKAPFHLVALAVLIAASGSSAGEVGGTDSAFERVRADEQKRIDVMARAARSVVCIFDESRGGGGAGVVITPDGLGLTNFHVLAAMLKTRRGLGGMSDGKAYPLEVLGVDPTGDVAMFRLTGQDRFEAAPLGDSDQVRAGDRVFAMGNPFALAEDYTPSATQGIASGVHRYQFGADRRKLVYTDCIQIDASINPGNSGGPLFDMRGRVIGINGRASFKGRGRVNVGLAYAISINQIKRFIPGMRAGLLVEHGSLGATAIDVGYGRVVFDEMLEPSPASEAGIEVGDRLVRFAGRQIHSSNQFANILGALPAAWPVEVAFEREGQLISRTVELERLPVKLDAPFSRDESVTSAEGQRAAAAQPTTRPLPGPNALGPAIAQAIRRTVKIYGAGIGGERGYGTGVIASPDGQVVTVLSLLLEAASLRVVTHDGHVYRGRVTCRDEYRQLALVKMARFPENVDTTATVHQQMTPIELEPYPMGGSGTLRSGDWILAVGNPFKVANGEEPLSVMQGIVCGRGPLDAVRETQPFPYRGEVILLDAITSNVGAPGGAVVDLDGRWVGLIGKVVKSRLTNTYLNYAYPIEEVKAFVQDAQSGPGTTTSRAPVADAAPGYHGIRLSKIGYRKLLPFVTSVARGSPAKAAGVRPDDLIVSADGVAIPRARAFTELCERLRAGDTLSLIVKRGEQLVPIRITLTEVPK